MRLQTRRTVSRLLGDIAPIPMKTTALALIVFLTLPSLAHAEDKQDKLPSPAHAEDEQDKLPSPAHAKDKQDTLPSLAQAEHKQDKLFTAVRIGMWTAQAMDLSVTQRILGAGTGREGNTVTGWTTRDPFVAAATRVGGAIAIDYLLRQTHRKNRTLAIWTGIGVTAAYSIVLAHNWQVMRAAELGR